MKRHLPVAALGAILAGALLITGDLHSVSAKRPGGNLSPTSAIALNEPLPLSLGSRVTFTTAAVGLSGPEYPMVYVSCVQAGRVVYGQLDHPDVVFVLGGGSSPWWLVGGQADCTAQLLAYGGKSQGVDTIRLLALTGPFSAN